MVGQMDFADAMRHKSVVTEVACSALKEGKRSLLGVLYDEVARQVKKPGSNTLQSVFFFSVCKERLGGALGEAGRLLSIVGASWLHS